MDEIRKFLVRLGYDYIYGYLDVDLRLGTCTQNQPINYHSGVQELKKSSSTLHIYPMSERNRLGKGVCEGAHHIYLGHIEDRLEEIPG